MANVTYSAGIATAYGAAVRGGYTGTYDDFCRQQAEYAESAAAVEQAKEDAEAAASAADTSKTAAAGSASAAATSAGQASTSATNAANSATEANASKNAAATSATEAGNSATAAAGSASDAQNSADDAQASAEAAAQSAASVDVHADGNYPKMTVGTSEQLLSTQYVTEKTPYLYRTTGGSSDVGDREYVRGITGGTVAWNQLAQGDFASATWWYSVHANLTVSNNEAILELTDLGTREVGQLRSPSLPIPSGHVVFGCGELFTSVAADKYMSWGGGLGTKVTGVANAWQTISNVVELPSFAYSHIRLGADSDQMTSGGTVKVRNAMVIDLTQMFGTTIADYIYGLEQANAGAGVAWVKKLFPNDYYPYDSGTLKSVEGVSSHEMVGFNQWDEEWELGYYDSDGEAKSSTSYMRCKSYIPVFPSTNYYATILSDNLIYICEYDSNYNFINGSRQNRANSVFTTNAKTKYLRFSTGQAYGTTYNHDICINLAWSGTHNGEYKPYEKHTYALDSSLTLRGVPKLDRQKNLYFNGDVYAPDGTVQRRYGSTVVSTNNVVAIGTASTGIKYVQVASMPFTAKGNTFNILTTKGYTPVSVAPSVSGRIRSMGQDFYVYDNAFTDLDTAKSLLAGMGIVCELATPTTEEADPYTEIQICDDWGTEEYVSTSIVPVGHTTDYPANLRDKLQHLPDLASADGNYIVSQSGTKMTLAPLPIVIPAPPTTDGTYTMKATVANGLPTMSWVAE